MNYGLLISWKRWTNLPDIIESMLPFVDHVRVFNNYPCSETAEFLWSLTKRYPCHISHNGRNTYTAGRYLGANHREDVDAFITCDDDVLVENWEELLDKHRETGRIAANLDKKHSVVEYETFHPFRFSYHYLVGWGAAFSPKHVSVVATHLQKPNYWRYGDVLFTMLQCQKPEIIEVSPNHLPGATGPEALYRRQEHAKIRDMAINKALDLIHHL